MNLDSWEGGGTGPEREGLGEGNISGEGSFNSEGKQGERMDRPRKTYRWKSGLNGR